MKRSQLELAIHTASTAIGQAQVLVIGSQAILGSFTERDLPERAYQSREVDIAPLTDDENESLATLIDVTAGEWSPFDKKYGFYVQGVGVRTAYLPQGWFDRLVEVRADKSGTSIGLCLEPHDLCAAKLARNDEKDREFVTALVRAKLVDARTIVERIELIDDARFTNPQRATSLSFARHLAGLPLK